MKPQKNKLPLIIAVSVALFALITAFTIKVIHSSDASMRTEKYYQNRDSMRQAAENVQKSFDEKSEFISGAAKSLSGSEKDFAGLLKKKAKPFKKLTKYSGMAHLLVSDMEGKAYDCNGKVFSLGDLDFFPDAAAGHTGISGKTILHVDDGTESVIVYYAPVAGEEGNLAILVGLASDELDVAAFTGSEPNVFSGMYILDGSGALVMSSDRSTGGSFYRYIKQYKLADGKDYRYREYGSINDAEAQEDEDASGQKEDSRTYFDHTDYFDVDLTGSRSVFSMINRRDVYSSIYHKKQLRTNDWTLYYVLSEQLPDSTVSFIVLSRVLLFAIVAIFFVTMAVLLLLQWKNGQKIASLAFTDEVTGCANWHKFVTVCNSHLTRKSWWKSRHAALCVDINRFTIYNDYYGHKAGNQLLRYVAQTIEQMCSSREYAARRSNDIFVVLWSYSSVDELNSRIDSFFERMKDGPNSENVSLSVGVYLLTGDDKDIIHAADMASIAEQSTGDVKVNTVAYFDDKLRTRMTEEHELEKLMHAALENDEFKLFIQPKHRVKDGALGGAEALVRWISPQKGFISPGKFIPLFEKNGFVGPVDNYILEQLCMFQRNRLRKGYKTVPISVNVSRVQLSNPNLADEICAIVDKYSVPHKYIDIELTESACFDDMETLINTIHTLRAMGFPVSMDDFGSGYSSLNLLKELPFDTLKIDGEFFRNVTDINRANIVVKNIIDLAKSLNMTVVAEGIEQQTQVDFLKTTECDLIQGYFYSKPISAKEFEEYMANHKIENK